MKRLEASDLPVAKVFSSDFEFRIPDYQRPYAWKPEQARQLLDDLSEALTESPDEPYFLGSLVLVKSSDRAHSEVIDGQQRLTTLTILLAVIRDLLDSASEREDVNSFINQKGSDFLGQPTRPRLLLRERDQPFFVAHVQQIGGTDLLLGPAVCTTDAQSSIRANAVELRAALAGRTADELGNLVRYLLMQTYLVVVSTIDLDSAHRIFSVMNSRGLDLSPADIFKSLVIGRLGPDQRGNYAKVWEDCEEDLGRDSFADMFLHIRMIFARTRARRELLKEFPEQVLSKYLPGNPEGFVDDVVRPYADAYEQLRDESYAWPQGADEVNALLRRLNRIDNNDWRPAAMWALNHKGADPDYLVAFLTKLERVASSMLIRRVYTTPRATLYAELMQQLADWHGLDSPAFDLTPAEVAETKERLAGDVYLTAAVRKYVLLRLDEVLAATPGVLYTHRLITVEHVLPQHPEHTSDWVTIFSDEERMQWTHKLANLVLLTRAKNSEAQRYDFAKKKEKYFASRKGVSSFALTSQVLGEAEWTPQVLESRQAKLLQLLYTEWSLK